MARTTNSLAIAGLAGLAGLAGWLYIRSRNGTAPDVAEPAPALPPAKRRRGLTRQFDATFERYRDRIPLAYMRALASRESSFDPSDTEGAAWGLMQVTPVVLRSWNKRTGENVKRGQLLDPDTNVKIAADTLNRIVRAYNANHPAVLGEDWNSRRYVELVTAGWNAGWSQAAGVQRVVTYLQQKTRRMRGDAPSITVDEVQKNAAAAGAVRWLAMPDRLRWWKSVAELYFAQVDRTPVA